MLRSLFRVPRKFRSINERYRTPRIGMSPGVRAALMLLRVYLLVLVVLMLVKFAQLAAA